MVGSLFLFANEKFNELSDKIARIASLGASQTISSLTALTTPLNADLFPVTDTANATTKKLSYSNLKTTLISDWATQWSAYFSTSAGLRGLLSDETGSGGAAVFATAPTISGAQLTSSPTLTTPVINVGSDADGDLYWRSGGLFTRLAKPTGSNYYLHSSSTNSQYPEWNNSVVSFPYTASSTFMATTTWQDGAYTIGANLFASSTAGSAITGNTLPQPVSLSTSTNRINPADANDLMFFDNFHGFAMQSGASGASIVVQTDGIVNGFSGLTPGADYYVQDAAGTIGTTVGTYEMKVGRAISATQIKIERGQGEYLGSVAYSQSWAGVTSCAAYATSTYMARNFISDVTTNGAGGGAPVIWHQTIPHTRVGATSVQNYGSLGSPATLGNQTVAISGNVVTLSGGYSSGGSNGSCSGTLYMYR